MALKLQQKYQQKLYKIHILLLCGEYIDNLETKYSFLAKLPRLSYMLLWATLDTKTFICI